MTLGAVLTLTHATPGWADYPEVSWGRPANGTHTYCYNNLTPSGEDVARYAMVRLRDTTDMDIRYVARDCGGDGDITDVTWNSTDLDPGTRGLYRAKYTTNGVTHWGEVHLDFAELKIGDNDWHDMRKTSMHELGHSVGLRHNEPGEQSAMISGEVPSTHWVWRSYSPEDRRDINRVF